MVAYEVVKKRIGFKDGASIVAAAVGKKIHPQKQWLKWPLHFLHSLGFLKVAQELEDSAGGWMLRPLLAMALNWLLPF